MKVKTADLIGPALDWAVGTALNLPVEICQIFQYGRPNGEHYISIGETDKDGAEVTFEPSEEWSQGGPLIQQECLDVRVFAEHGAPDGGPYWIAERYPSVGHGPTPLIAAMRCYCCAKLGEYTDIPEELCQRANS